MKEINISENRMKQFKWFEQFSNSCYAIDTTIDVTNIVLYSKEKQLSFFIIMLYIVTKTLNDVEEMRMRYVKGKPVIFDKVTPAYTVMTKTGTFENVRHEYLSDFQKFYELASSYIEATKNQTEIKKGNYNPEDCWNELYITCLPWLHFNRMSHPLPDDKSSQSIPRICWSKYIQEDDKYKLTFNITVSHMFVDGYPLATAINNLQENINNLQKNIK